MSESDIYRWQIFCIDEGQAVTWYRDINDPPTMCVNNSNHQVNPNSTVRWERIGPNLLQVTDTSPNLGYFQMSSIKVNIPATNTVPQTITVDNTYPFDMYIWETSISQYPNHIGDEINIQIAPDTPIATLLQSTNVGDTTIYASPTIFNHIYRGCEIGITDGVHKEYSGRIKEINSLNGSIKFEIPLINSYIQGSVVLFSVYPIRHLFFDSDRRIIIGSKGLKSRVIPANTIFRITYIDNTVHTSPIDIYIQMQYYHI